jgi:hypothetical protein
MLAQNTEEGPALGDENQLDPVDANGKLFSVGNRAE